MSGSQPHAWLQSELTVQSADGLHARPAIKVARLARKYGATIQVRVAGDADWVDAKSVAKLMSLRAEEGKVIELRASGNDAGDAIAGLGGFFARDFDESGEGAG
jgi:phosphocarrier protein